MRHFNWIKQLSFVAGLLLALLTAGCQGGAVVFAPTPLPPDLSPLPFTHPDGIFSISVPRNWPVFTQRSATLASVTFTHPEADTPLLTAAVVNLGQPIAPTSLGALMADYQANHRPDRNQYREQDRSAMGDGSWRISGVRTTDAGVQQLNTFIEASGAYFSIIEVVVPADSLRTPMLMTELQNAVNTFRVIPDNSLQPTELSTLSFVRRAGLEVVNIAGWTTPAGVFFVTGEVSNNTGQTLASLPVQVALLDSAGSVLDSAADLTMGYGIPPGAFMPFSVRFGAGQPPEAVRYVVQITTDTLPEPETPFAGRDALTWDDTSTFADNGDLLITGEVRHTGGAVLRDPLAIVTVFDDEGRVIGAWFAPLPVQRLEAGQAAPFEIRVAELGGDPINYIVELQGRVE